MFGCLLVPIGYSNFLASRLKNAFNHLGIGKAAVADVSVDSHLGHADFTGEGRFRHAVFREVRFELHSFYIPEWNIYASPKIPRWFLNMSGRRYRSRGMPNIRNLREAQGLTQAQLAKLVGTSQPQIRRLEAGERKLTKEWAKRLAPHLQTTAKELMFDVAEEDASTFEVEGLPIVGTSRAGDWLDITMIDAGEHDYETIPVARNARFPRARQYALLVSGDSMNLVFAEGTYVTCVDFADSGLSLTPGMIVHVERTLAGRQLVETTVKKVGVNELLPLSSNPIHKPLPISGNGDTEITVRGVVIGKWEPIAFEGLGS